MLDLLNKRRNFNVLSCVPKNDEAITKNIQIKTRQGTKIGGYNAQIEKIQRKQEDYPNPWKERQIFNNTS